MGAYERLKYEPFLSYGINLNVQNGEDGFEALMTLTMELPQEGKKVLKTRCIPIYASDSFFSFKYGIDQVETTHYGLTMMHIDPTGQHIDGYFLSRKLWELSKIGFGYIELEKDDKDGAAQSL